MKFRDLINYDYSINWNAALRIKEFKDLESCEQSSIWHKEGNALEHTKRVCEEMKNQLHKNIAMTDDEKVLLTAAALCHDLGKPSTTYFDEKKQQPSCKAHGRAGAIITRRIFFDEEINLREAVCFLVMHHMAYHHILDKDGKKQEYAINRLEYGSKIVNVNYFALLGYCDSFGSISDITNNDKESHHSKILKLINDKLIKFNSDNERIEYFRNEKIHTDKKGFTNPNFEVIIMCGVAGSGKSTHIEVYNEENYPVISRDTIRESLGLKSKELGNKQIENKVTEIFDELFETYLNEGKSFIVDNMNILQRWRINYGIQRAGLYTPNIKIVYVEAPSMKDNVNRREGEIPEDVIQSMWNRFEFPEINECKELVICKQ